jgi:hypothetical protein
MKKITENKSNLIYQGDPLIKEINRCESVNDLIDLAIQGCRIDKIEFYPVKQTIPYKHTDGSERIENIYFTKEEMENNFKELILKIPPAIGEPFGQHLIVISNSFFEKLLAILKSIESKSNSDIIEQIKALQSLIMNLQFEREYFERFNLFMLTMINIRVIASDHYELQIYPHQITSSENFLKAIFKDSKNKFDFFCTLILLLERTSMSLKHKVKEFEHKVSFKNENAGRRLLYEIFFTLKNSPGYFEISNPDVFRTNLFRVFNLSDTIPGKKGPKGERYFLDAILSRKKDPKGEIKKFEGLFLEWHRNAYRNRKTKKTKIETPPHLAT